MPKKLTVDELLEKAKKPAKLALAYHPFYGGKVQVMPKCVIRGSQDFAIWYTPGVAASCKAIKMIQNKFSLIRADGTTWQLLAMEHGS